MAAALPISPSKPGSYFTSKVPLTAHSASRELGEREVERAAPGYADPRSVLHTPFQGGWDRLCDAWLRWAYSDPKFGNARLTFFAKSTHHFWCHRSDHYRKSHGYQR